MNKLILARFRDYVQHNYRDADMTTHTICSVLDCSKTYLHDLLKRECGCAAMEYVRYFRILKSIELIFDGKTKVYLHVGYKTSAAFSNAFFNITGFYASCFYASELEKHKEIIFVAYNIAAECPKKALQFITNNSSIRAILSEQQNKIDSNSSKK